MNKKKKISWLGGVALLALVLFVAGCALQAQPVPSPADPEPVAVRVAPVETHTQAPPVRTSGQLASKAETPLAFKIGGYVAEILVEEGARVRAGQVLARLNTAEVDAQIAQAQTALDKAERDLRRAERLFADRVATQEQVENAQSGFDAAQAAFEGVAFSRRHAVIRAPEDGRILRRLREENEYVSAGKTLVVLASRRQGFVVRVGLADRDVVRLQVGDQAQLQFDAFPDQRVRGTVTEVAEAADPYSGTFEVEIRVHAGALPLKSGFIAKVDLLPSRAEPFQLVPVQALVEAHGRTGAVFAADLTTNTAQKRRVEIAHLTQDHVAIRSGLAGVSAVVTDGAAYLSDAAPITVVE